MSSSWARTRDRRLRSFRRPAGWRESGFGCSTASKGCPSRRWTTLSTRSSAGAVSPAATTPVLSRRYAAVRRFGSLEICTFVPGWFSETLADFDEELSVAFVDVDLTESTRQAVAAAWPSLVDGGVLFVHDAADAKLRTLLADADWWRELGAEPRTSFLPSRTDGFLERRSRTLT